MGLSADWLWWQLMARHCRARETTRLVSSSASPRPTNAVPNELAVAVVKQLDPAEPKHTRRCAQLRRAQHPQLAGAAVQRRRIAISTTRRPETKLAACAPACIALVGTVPQSIVDPVGEDRDPTIRSYHGEVVL